MSRRVFSSKTRRPITSNRTEQIDNTSPPIVVFKTTTRGKRLFKQYDTQGTGYLNQQQFNRLIIDFCTSNYMNYQPTQQQLNCLFDEFDINHDDKISLNEYLEFMCGTTNKQDNTVKQTTSISIHSPIPTIDKTVVSINDMIDMLESLYLYNNRNYRDVDLANAKNINNIQLKKLLNNILLSETAESKKQNRSLQYWSLHALDKGGITQTEADNCFNHLKSICTVKNNGKNVDLTNLFDIAKNRKQHDSKNKKNAKNTNDINNKKPGKIQLINGIYEIYTLKSVEHNMLNNFLTEQSLNELMQLNNNFIYKVHPVLSHWGNDFIYKYGLSHGNNGYKQYVINSLQSKVKQIIKHNDSIRLYGTVRISYIHLCYIEQLYCVCIVMDICENITHIDISLKRSWLDSENDIYYNNDVIRLWSEVVIQDDEYNQTSIPL